MPEKTRQGEGFGAVATQYDRARPDYPSRLVDALLEGLGPAPRVLEVGCGTGIATRSMLVRGASVTALDPDPEMIAVARSQSTDAAVAFTASRLENWRPGDQAGSYDLVAASQSWHWVDEVRGYAIAAESLRSGGRLALFWNRPAPGGFEHRDLLDAVYEAEAPDLRTGSGGRTHSFTSLDSLQIPPPFVVQPTLRFPWTEILSTDAYIDLLGTHSDHLLLDADRLDRLFGRVRDAIDRAGGTIETRYESVLVQAVRR